MNQYSIIQKLDTNTQNNIGDLSPIYIGTAKKFFNTQISTVSNKQFILTVDSNYKLISDTLKLNLSYWKLYTDPINLTVSQATNIINITVGTYQPVQANDMFVCIDGSNNIVFNSNISTLIYGSGFVQQITLDQEIPIGTYTFYIIRKVYELIPVQYDSSTSSVSFIIDLFTANNFNSIDYNLSTISYFASLNSYKAFIINTIDDINDDLGNYGYNELGFCVNNHFTLSSNKCVAISIPDETYIDTLLDDLRINDYGYFLVPINTTDFFDNQLFSYIKTSDKFYSLILSNMSLNTSYSITHVGNDPTQYVEPTYVDIEYVF